MENTGRVHFPALAISGAVAGVARSARIPFRGSVAELRWETFCKSAAADFYARTFFLVVGFAYRRFLPAWGVHVWIIQGATFFSAIN